MKIEKMVTVDAEVEVHISLDDIISAIYEEADALDGVLCGLNNVATFMRAIPDSLVGEMNDAQKALVKTFLQKQADRF